MATVHANNPREAISRLEQMIGMAGLPMSQLSIRGQISAAIRLIIQLQRLADGKRRVTSVAEITGMEGEIIQMQEIFKYVRTGTDRGTVHRGRTGATGLDDRLRAAQAEWHGRRSARGRDRGRPAHRRRHPVARSAHRAPPFVRRSAHSRPALCSSTAPAVGS